MVISSFRKDFCELIGIEKGDPRCNVWQDVLPDQSLSFGRYDYKVSWSGEEAQVGQIDIGDAHDDDKTFYLEKK